MFDWLFGFRARYKVQPPYRPAEEIPATEPPVVPFRIKTNPQIMTLDNEGIEELILSEGIRLKPYYDTVGVPTIAVGNTYYENGTKVKITDPAISRDRAMQLFKNTLASFESWVFECLEVPQTANQFNALVSLCYNIGKSAFAKSTLLKRINEGASDAAIKESFLMWNKPPEIRGRRNREVNRYFKV